MFIDMAGRNGISMIMFNIRFHMIMVSLIIGLLSISITYVLVIHDMITVIIMMHIRGIVAIAAYLVSIIHCAVIVFVMCSSIT